MQILDTRQNVRLAILLEMLEDVSRATDPEQAVQAYARRIGKLRPVDAVLAVSVRSLAEGEYKITRRIVAEVDGEPRHEVTDPWRNWSRLGTHRGGFIGELISAPEPRLIHGLFLKDDPVLGDMLSEMGSCLAIPVFDGGRVLNWTLQFRRDAAGFSIEELEQNVLAGNLFGAMTRNLVALEQINRLNDRLHQQFEEVARLQQSLLPAELPLVPGLALATSYLTSEQAGGDYFDFFNMPGGKLGVIVADVSGHGPGAATVMAMLHAMIHGSAVDLRTAGPVEVVRLVNRQLVRAGMEGAFVTAFVGLYDPVGRELRFVSAGHPPARRRDAGGGVRELVGESTLPMGVVEEMEIPENRVVLGAGESLVLYTDGITEAFAPRAAAGGREMFGIDGLDRALGATPALAGPDALIDAVHAAVFEHTGKRTRDDDQTLVVMRTGVIAEGRAVERRVG